MSPIALYRDAIGLFLLIIGERRKLEQVTIH